MSSFLVLTRLGWDARRQQEFEAWAERGLRPARVARVDRDGSLVFTADRPLRAEPSPALRRQLDDTALPAVGDWVAIGGDRGATEIEHVLERRTAVVRSAPGTRTAAQVLASNVDTLFVVVGLAAPPKPSRIERFVTLAWESGAQPVVLLTKADLCTDVVDAVQTAQRSAPGVPVHAVSALNDEGMSALDEYVTTGRTVALVGASGAGKSTLANRLLGESHFATTDLRSDGKGRHTTTFRELVVLPGGGLLIDTPGLRALQLWAADDAIERTFADIEQLADACRFRDCAHVNEPGCAVLDAVRSGALDAGRLERYRKLLREQRYLASKQDVLVRMAERRKIREIARSLRERPGRP